MENRISATVDPDLKNLVEKKAENERRSQNSVVRQAIDAFFSSDRNDL